MHGGEIAQQKEFLNDIRALTKLRAQNIVKFHGFCSHPQHLFLIYEYLERGSLATILTSDEEAKELDWKRGIISLMVLLMLCHTCTMIAHHQLFVRTYQASKAWRCN